ncbi:MAG: acyltransferase [Acidobacteria bacterium]|nr:acyltransferase [Acidobacteriota bacterium]
MQSNTSGILYLAESGVGSTAGQRDSGRLLTLDCLRGIAAFAVLWFHFTNGNAEFLPQGVLKSSGRYGWLGVEVFFVISGFILPYALQRAGYQSADFFRFVWKRILRLDPPYIVCIALVLVLNFASTLVPGFRGQPFQFDSVQILLHLGYLNALFGYEWVNVVFWTLAIEFQFYLLVALLFPLISHSSLAVRAGVCLVLAMTAFLLPSEKLVFHYLFLFLIGIFAFQIKGGLLGSARLQVAGWALLAAGAWFTLGDIIAIAGTMTGLLIVHARLNASWLLFLGQISYSLYLLHVPIGGRIINLGSRFAHGPMEQVLVLALAVTISIGAAFLFHRWVELPAQRWSSAVRFRAVNRPTLKQLQT